MRPLLVVLMLLLAGCLSSQTVVVKLEPKQCEVEPWGDPSVSALSSYYEGKGIFLSNVTLHQREGAVCLACGVCPKSYYYTAEALSTDLPALEEEGWVTLSGQ